MALINFGAKLGLETLDEPLLSVLFDVPLASTESEELGDLYLAKERKEPPWETSPLKVATLPPLKSYLVIPLSPQLVFSYHVVLYSCVYFVHTLIIMFTYHHP